MIVGKQVKYLFINKSAIKYMLVEIEPQYKNPYTYINLYTLNADTWVWKFERQIEIRHKVNRPKKNIQTILPIVGWMMYFDKKLPDVISKTFYIQCEKEYWAHIQSELIEDESIGIITKKEYHVR